MNKKKTQAKKPTSAKRAKSRATKRPLNLPTLAAFKHMNIPERTKVFRDWAATKKGDYNSISNDNCALAQLSKALGADENVRGSSDSIYHNDEFIQVTELALIHQKGPALTSFASLVKRLDTYMKTGKVID